MNTAPVPKQTIRRLVRKAFDEGYDTLQIAYAMRLTEAEIYNALIGGQDDD